MPEQESLAVLQIEVGGEIQYKRPQEHCLSFVMCPRSGFKRRCFVGCPMLSIYVDSETSVKFCGKSSWAKTIVRDLRVKDTVLEDLIKQSKPRIEITGRNHPFLDALDAPRALQQPVTGDEETQLF